MICMTVESAKDIGIAIAVFLVVLMVVMFMLIKKATTKLISVVIVGGLALGVWTQRNSLEDCAGKVKARAALGDTSDLTCTFLGYDTKVSVPGAS
jgi:hypothetical protein